MPVMMLLLFGFALSLDVDRIPTLIYDQDQTQASRDLIKHSRRRGSSRYAACGQLRYGSTRHRPQPHPDGRGDSARLLAEPGRIARGAGADSADGSDSNTASIALGTRKRGAELSLELRTEMMNRRGGERIVPPVDARLRCVQQLARIQELLCRGCRGDSHDYRVVLTSLPSRASGNGDHGAVAIDAAAARRDGAGKDAGVFRGGLVDSAIAVLVGV